MSDVNFFELMKKADNVETLSSGIPDGWHKARIETAELKNTKAGDGVYLSLKLRLENNQVYYCNINVKNPNEAAVNIGLGLLKALKGATGIMSANSPVVFEGKKIEFLLKTNKGGNQNCVSFRAINRVPEIPENKIEKSEKSDDDIIF